MPINLLAGTVLPSVGEATLEQLRLFNGAWFATAVGVHICLSLAVGMVFVVSLPMMPRRPLLAGGLILCAPAKSSARDSMPSHLLLW